MWQKILKTELFDKGLRSFRRHWSFSYEQKSSINLPFVDFHSFLCLSRLIEKRKIKFLFKIFLTFKNEEQS